MKFHMPTSVIMDTDCVVKNKAIFEKLGKSCMIVTGKTSAKINGSLDDVKKVLEANSQEYLVFDKVMSNPTIDIVLEGASIAKENKVDFLVAIGGGSPMDACKAIAVVAKNDNATKEIFNYRYNGLILPSIFIPTTSGTGSEVTQYAILTDDTNQTKTTLAFDYMFPTYALLDPKYQTSLGRKTTINTCIDALTHLIEGYLSIKASNLTRDLSIYGIELIASKFDKLLKFDLSLKDRETLLEASTIGGMVIAHTGTTAVHSMGYSLTYFKEIDHGRANGLLIYEFLKLIEIEYPETIKSILDALKLAKLEDFKEVLDKLLGEKENITIDELKNYASIAIKAKNIKNSIINLTETDLYQIYQNVFIKEGV